MVTKKRRRRRIQVSACFFLRSLDKRRGVEVKRGAKGYASNHCQYYWAGAIVTSLDWPLLVEGALRSNAGKHSPT